MKLLEVCEPLFEHVCLLNRSARLGLAVEMHKTREEFEELFARMRRKASEANLESEYERVRLPLVYFVDFMIREGQLDFARQWREMAHDENMFAGYEHFWDLLDETLADQSRGAAERLSVFYVCIGLGFTGINMGQPELLRKKMMEISSRIRSMIDNDEKARICPEAYEHTDTSDLVQPPGRSIAVIVVALVVLVGVLLAGNAYLYLTRSSAMRASLTTLGSPDGGPASVEEGE